MAIFVAEKTYLGKQHNYPEPNNHPEIPDLTVNLFYNH